MIKIQVWSNILYTIHESDKYTEKEKAHYSMGQQNNGGRYTFEL